MSGAERTRVESFGHPEDGLERGDALVPVGPLPLGARVGDRARGLQRRRRGLGLLPARPCPLPRLPMGRGRHGRRQRRRQQLCMALALWNGRDPILKERMFGLTGPQGNHGEDVKEYWWFMDAVPSHAWLRWRYHYPQAEFPYADLVAENGRRDQSQPEYELLDTGVFDDDRYWVVDVTHAKDDPHDLLMEVSVTNAGPETSTLHVLPHLWFRNTWSWDVDAERPTLRATGPDRGRVDHPRFGELTWELDAGPDGATPDLLFCDNDTNLRRLYGSHGLPGVPEGRDQRPRRRGRCDREPGPRRHQGCRLVPPHRRAGGDPGGPGPAPAALVLARVRHGVRRRARQRHEEADEFYAEVIPASVDDDARLVARQAFAGMLWGKQFYCYDVKRWLDGDPDPAAATARTSPAAATPAGSTSTPRTSSRCPTRGSIPGSLPGTSPSTPWRWPTSTRRSPSTSCSHVPGVVPEPQRRAACLRVGVRRREPARACLGGAARLGHRRAPRHRLPGPVDAEAADELHLVGQPDGPRGRPPLRRRVPRPGQHQRDRPVAPAAGGPARAGRRHQLDGLLLPDHAGDGADPGRRRTTPGPTSR